MHGPALTEFTAKAFGGGDYWRMRERFGQDLDADRPVDWTASTIGLLGDEIISSWLVWPYWRCPSKSIAMTEA